MRTFSLSLSQILTELLGPSSSYQIVYQSQANAVFTNAKLGLQRWTVFQAVFDYTGSAVKLRFRTLPQGEAKR